MKLSSWYRANGLSVHPKKSKFIIFKPTNFHLWEEIIILFNNNDPGVKRIPLKFLKSSESPTLMKKSLYGFWGFF